MRNPHLLKPYVLIHKSRPMSVWETLVNCGIENNFLIRNKLNLSYEHLEGIKNNKVSLCDALVDKLDRLLNLKTGDVRWYEIERKYRTWVDKYGDAPKAVVSIPTNPIRRAMEKQFNWNWG